MKKNDGIVTPLPAKHPSSIGDFCVMVGNPADMDFFCRRINPDENGSRRLFLSRLFSGSYRNKRFSVLGPFIGAPYAAMLQETIISWGGRQIIFLGWCGAVSPDVHIGDIILPTSSLIDDGTSNNYLKDGIIEASPSKAVQERLKKGLIKKKLSFLDGRIWSTDAIYRETPEKVFRYQGKHVLAVDMEAAALFSVGIFRSVDVGCVLVVSDDLSSGTWIRGFSTPGFKDARQAVCRMLCEI